MARAICATSNNTGASERGNPEGSLIWSVSTSSLFAGKALLLSLIAPNSTLHIRLRRYTFGRHGSLSFDSDSVALREIVERGHVFTLEALERGSVRQVVADRTLVLEHGNEICPGVGCGVRG